MAELDQVNLERLTQALAPSDPTNLQLVLRVLAIQVTPTVYKGGTTHELQSGALEYETAFEGPWEATIIALKFLKDVPGAPAEYVESQDPKTFYVGIRMGGEIFKIAEEVDFIGTQFVIDGPLTLGAEDQIVIGGTGTDRVKLQVRGRKL